MECLVGDALSRLYSQYATQEVGIDAKDTQMSSPIEQCVMQRDAHRLVRILEGGRNGEHKLPRARYERRPMAADKGNRFRAPPVTRMRLMSYVGSFMPH